MKVSIDVTVQSPLEQVWSAWTTPEDIMQWNFASPEWCCPRARIELAEGGSFSYRMEAKDGSMGFDFEGTFLSIVEHREIRYALEDDRAVSVTFEEKEGGVRIIETFDAEDEQSAEQQKQGWQCILENFKRHVESKAG
jgi:uncharacterized protein YndB with AHSA1/START domain